MAMTMRIGLTELYDASLHGRTENTSPDIAGEHLVVYSFCPQEFVADPSEALGLLSSLSQVRCNTGAHPPSLQLVEVRRLKGNEEVATIRTDGITRLQRSWRRKQGSCK